jgi:hypothetical protein
VLGRSVTSSMTSPEMTILKFQDGHASHQNGCTHGCPLRVCYEMWWGGLECHVPETSFLSVERRVSPVLLGRMGLLGGM